MSAHHCSSGVRLACALRRQLGHRRRQAEADPRPHLDADPPLLHLDAGLARRRRTREGIRGDAEAASTRLGAEQAA